MNNKHMEINKKFTGLDVTQKLELFVQEMCMSNLHFGLRLQTHMIGKKKGSAKNICIVEIIKKYTISTFIILQKKLLDIKLLKLISVLETIKKTKKRQIF